MWSLLNKAKWLLSGNILFAFSQWLMLIMFSHFSNPIQLGYYSYALALTAPIFMLSNLQLRPLVVADLNLERKFSFSEYFSLRLLTILFAIDRKSTRLNSSHVKISYAVFCLKKKKVLNMRRSWPVVE